MVKKATGTTTAAKAAEPPKTNTVERDKLKEIIGGIEDIELEKRSLGEDQKQLFSAAKAAGYNTKIIRKLVALRRKDQVIVEEEDALLDEYKQAMGMMKG